MKYIGRHIETVLRKAQKQTKVVLLTGARQVGKSTSVREVFPDYTYITLDDENELSLALHDRSLFFRDRSYPLIIDEAQYARDLMRAVKRVVDADKEKGRIILTGSQTYELMSQTSESLAGRVTILEMPSLSMREILGIPFHDAFLPASAYLKKRAQARKPYVNLWEHIHRGSMPELQDPERDREWFYRDYIRTYMERDVRRIVNIQDETKFRALLSSIAARSGQLLVYDDIAKDIGVDIKTAQRWISVVEGSGLIKILRPYYSNVIKRAVKTPKLFFLDTGLLCYLVGWSSAETARNGAMSGQIFETFVVSEIIKSFLNTGKNLERLYYYRDKEKREIDLLIEDDHTLYPIEIKKGATIRPDWAKSFSVLGKITDRRVAPGTVLCLAENPVPVSGDVTALPVDYI